MTEAPHLRSRAEGLASAYPPLLASAERLAANVQLGDHGRRRSGSGDAFWQYRPLQTGDDARLIDWRRSARGDEQFIKQREWQVAQSALLWVDQASSMNFASSDKVTTKAERARLIGMATAILLVRGGERVALGAVLPPRRGNGQLERIATALVQDRPDDYGIPDLSPMVPNSRALIISDFLGDLGPLKHVLTRAAGRGIRGVLMQVLDPAEEEFPFRGRTVFESMTGSVRHETLRADTLRDRYLERLAERKAELADLALNTGWLVGHHHTSEPAQSALLWVYQAVQGAR
ncbi:DUF58 domain-containing protein [Donghicola sp. C2-DW-16]|uniref:DUF58 domain-containing protein n=1 Tax=Donghicola mangrovi TaxID=2729614 RepID=A0ABX2PAW0_9RHOB|nr:DUF58 domain-containing protein [Donghicola mangrovi]